MADSLPRTVHEAADVSAVSQLVLRERLRPRPRIVGADARLLP
jgi:hypothetical protein